MWYRHVSRTSIRQSVLRTLFSICLCIFLHQDSAYISCLSYLIRASTSSRSRISLINRIMTIRSIYWSVIEELITFEVRFDMNWEWIENELKINWRKIEDKLRMKVNWRRFEEGLIVAVNLESQHIDNIFTTEFSSGGVLVKDVGDPFNVKPLGS